MQINNRLWILPLLYFVLLPFGALYNGALLLLAIVGLYACVSGKQSPDMAWKQYLKLFLCIFIPLCLSLTDAIQLDQSARKAFSFSLYIFTGLGIIKIFEDRKNVDSFLMGLGVLITLWVFDALFQYVAGQNLLGYPFDNAGGARRLTGIFYPKHRIGIVLAILSPLYFEFLRRLQPRVAYAWLLAIPLVIVVILGGSRTSWSMLFMSVILYGSYLGYSGEYRKIHAVAAMKHIIFVIIALVAIHFINPNLTERFTGFVESRVSTIEYRQSVQGKHNAVEERIAIWEAALRIAGQHWINGVGVRGFRHVERSDYLEAEPLISERARLSTHPHLIVLEILVETGIVGLAGYVLFWVFFIRMYISTLRVREYLACVPWAMPVVVSLFPLNMHKSVYENFSSTLIWVLVAMSVMMWWADADRSKRHDPGPHPYQP